jgi:hypothetical protein
VSNRTGALALLVILSATACLRSTFAASPPAAPVAPQVLAYRLQPGEPLRYKLDAAIKGSVPILDSPEPMDLTARITMTYTATPKTRLADGSVDVEFAVDEVELEVAKIPFPVPEDQARDILNQTITLATTGEVLRTQETKPLPFGVSIPGVDPKRLYALLFPIVFQSKAVKQGESWRFKSELLGGEGAKPVFTATLLPSENGKSGAKPSKSSPVPVTLAAGELRLKEQFSMAVDQKVTADKEQALNPEEVHRTRKGNIEGSGEFAFDQARGRVTRGTVNISANIRDELVGMPEKPDEPKLLVSKVQAKVTVALQPAEKASAQRADAKP